MSSPEVAQHTCLLRPYSVSGPGGVEYCSGVHTEEDLSTRSVPIRGARLGAEARTRRCGASTQLTGGHAHELASAPSSRSRGLTKRSFGPAAPPRSLGCVSCSCLADCSISSGLAVAGLRLGASSLRSEGRVQSLCIRPPSPTRSDTPKRDSESGGG